LGSLKDLSIPEDRVPQWIDLDYLPLDTSEWNEVILTCGNFQDNFLTPLRDAPDQTVLIIPAGCTFTESTGGMQIIRRNNIVVRGADKETSRLEFTRTWGGEGLIVINHRWARESPFGDARDWTAGYEMGDDVMTVAHTGGLTPGDWVRFQGNPEPDWHESSRHSYTTKLICVGPSGTPECSGLEDNQIKIDTELHAPFTQGGQEVLRITLPDEYVTNVGFENLTFTHTNPGTVDKYLPYINAKLCFECWITDVVFEEAGNMHYSFAGTARTVLRGNYHARVNWWYANHP